MYTRHFRRIDLLYATNDVWAYSILYFTGSMEFNVKLRNIALSKGYTLNEYGMKYTSGPKKNESIEEKLISEKDIMEFLGVKYIPPNERLPTINLDNYML